MRIIVLYISCSESPYRFYGQIKNLLWLLYRNDWHYLQVYYNLIRYKGTSMNFEDKL